MYFLLLRKRLKYEFINGLLHIWIIVLDSNLTNDITRSLLRCGHQRALSWSFVYHFIRYCSTYPGYKYCNPRLCPHVSGEQLDKVVDSHVFYVKLHDIRVLFSEFEWNEFQIFHDFWRWFHENSEKSTRMSAISDKQHNQTELSMLRWNCCRFGAGYCE